MQNENDRIAVIGLGCGGGRIAGHIRGNASSNLAVAAADTDVSALAELPDIRKITLGEEWAHRKGSGGNAVLGERAASASVSELKKFLEGAVMAVVAGGLGGGTATGGIRVLARLVRDEEIPCLFIVTMPFAFEGSWRREEAEKGLAALRELSASVVPVPNDLLFNQLPADTRAAEAFSLADSLLAKSIAGLMKICSSRGLITADFSTVKAMLQDRSPTCAVGIGAGEGEERWHEAMSEFLSCPFIGGEKALNQADAGVITLIGGPDLAIGEVQTCLSTFEQLFKAGARLAVGAYSEETLEGRIRIAGLICNYRDGQVSAARGAVPEEQPGGSTAGGDRDGNREEIQGELPLQEQNAGIFSGTQATTVKGQNLDVPTFQRQGVQLDV